MSEMDIEEIMKYLPHRYPFLLVDRVLDIEEEKRIVAIKNVTVNEPFFTGHFPKMRVMPGVLIIEALAQASGILAYSCKEWRDTDSLFYLGAVDKTKFKKVVTPGDQIRLESEVIKRRKSFWKFETKAYVGDELACSAEMTCAQGAVNP